MCVSYIMTIPTLGLQLIEPALKAYNLMYQLDILAKCSLILSSSSSVVKGFDKKTGLGRNKSTWEKHIQNNT